MVFWSNDGSYPSMEIFLPPSRCKTSSAKPLIFGHRSASPNWAKDTAWCKRPFSTLSNSWCRSVKGTSRKKNNGVRRLLSIFRRFTVTSLSPSCRSLSHWKPYLTITKRSQRTARMFSFCLRPWLLDWPSQLKAKVSSSFLLLRRVSRPDLFDKKNRCQKPVCCFCGVFHWEGLPGLKALLRVDQPSLSTLTITQ